MEKDRIFKFSNHALEQIKLRGISKEVVRKILLNPDQVVEEEGKKVYQSVQKLSLQFIRHLKSRSIMKVKYDKEVDVLYISFSKNKIKESDEDKPEIILDYDKQGSIVGIEILDASKKMKNPAKVEYEIA